METGRVVKVEGGKKVEVELGLWATIGRCQACALARLSMRTLGKLIAAAFLQSHESLNYSLTAAITALAALF